MKLIYKNNYKVDRRLMETTVKDFWNEVSMDINSRRFGFLLALNPSTKGKSSEDESIYNEDVGYMKWLYKLEREGKLNNLSAAQLNVISKVLQIWWGNDLPESALVGKTLEDVYEYYKENVEQTRDNDQSSEYDEEEDDSEDVYEKLNDLGVSSDDDGNVKLVFTPQDIRNDTYYAEASSYTQMLKDGYCDDFNWDAVDELSSRLRTTGDDQFIDLLYGEEDVIEKITPILNWFCDKTKQNPKDIDKRMFLKMVIKNDENGSDEQMKEYLEDKLEAMENTDNYRYGLDDPFRYYVEHIVSNFVYVTLRDQFDCNMNFNGSSRSDENEGYIVFVDRNMDIHEFYRTYVKTGEIDSFDGVLRHYDIKLPNDKEEVENNVFEGYELSQSDMQSQFDGVLDSYLTSEEQEYYRNWKYTAAPSEQTDDYDLE